jgi:Cu/Ag efflux protein CusF
MLTDITPYSFRTIGTKRALLILSLYVYTGCATAYTPPPLTVQHPAHPEAMAAPELPRSSTLTYGPSDRPSLQPAVAMAQHSGPGAHPSAQDSQPSIVGEGKVVAVVPESSQLVVDHKEIPGFMGAMTMGYRTEPPSLLAGVKPGDTVRFTIDPQRQTIIQLEKLHESGQR